VVKCGEKKKRRRFLDLKVLNLKLSFELGKSRLASTEQHGNVSKFELTQRVFIFRNTFN